jgi:hypothetical protein
MPPTDEVSKTSTHNHDDENAGAIWGASELGIMRDSRLRSRMRGSDGSQAVCRRGDLAASRNAKRSRDIGIIRLSQPLLLPAHADFASRTSPPQNAFSLQLCCRMRTRR